MDKTRFRTGYHQNLSFHSWEDPWPNNLRGKTRKWIQDRRCIWNGFSFKILKQELSCYPFARCKCFEDRRIWTGEKRMWAVWTGLDNLFQPRRLRVIWDNSRGWAQNSRSSRSKRIYCQSTEQPKPTADSWNGEVNAPENGSDLTIFSRHILPTGFHWGQLEGEIYPKALTLPVDTHVTTSFWNKNTPR